MLGTYCLRSPIAGIAFIVFLNVLATPITWKYPRVSQHLTKWTVNPVMGVLFDRFAPRAKFSREDVSSYFWSNGLLPTSEEWKRLAATGFERYRLKVYGLVEKPVELSLAEIKAMPKQEQITMHNFLQGWSGIAEWGGLSLDDLMKVVKPLSNARFLVFYSFGATLSSSNQASLGARIFKPEFALL